MKTSQRGKAAIKGYEGLRLAPYLCSAGKPTIGYGCTSYENGKAVTMQDSAIDMPRAESLFEFKVAQFERELDRLVKVTLNQNQLDALMSFIFNFGASALAQSTLLRLINLGKADEAMTAKEFDRWINANGKPVEGLKKRRAAEKALFLKRD